MVRYIIKRILLLIPVIIVVSFLVFALLELAPGTVIDSIVANLTNATPEDIAALEAQYDLDKPMIYRYGKYMVNLVQGNLGNADLSGISVWDTYTNRLPYTLALSLGGLIVGAVVSVPLGIAAARRAGKLTDTIATTFSMIGMSMPSFWLGILLIILFSQQLKWLPAGDAVNGFKSYILPSFCTGLMLMATSTRLTRSSMLEVLNSDFLRTARAKGVPEKAVIRTHALGNAWIPIITNMGMALSIMLAGSAVIEVAFTWPGVGRMLVNAVLARDVTTATGVVILTSILYVLINLIVDVIYAFVDPRIKSQYVSANRKRKKPAKTAKPAMNLQEPEPAPANLAAPDPLETYEAAAEPPSTEEIPKAETPQYPLNEDADMYTLVTKRYRKRSRMGDIIHHLSTNKGAIAGLIIVVALIAAIIASLFIRFDTITASNMQLRFAPPGPDAYFGTDNMGRDQFLRVIYGTRYSLFIGFGGVLVASVFGLILGALAGFYGKLADEIIMRFSDILASVPGMLLGMVIMIVMGNGTGNLVIAVGIPAIPIFIRITRASILSIRDNEYVEASRAIGFSNLRIVFTNILPNGLAPIIVTVTNYIGVMIIVGASLSFLGFGVPLPHPEWGTMIANSRVFIHSAPWLTLFPGLFIMITVLAFNLLGDGLRDALDPKQKK